MHSILLFFPDDQPFNIATIRHIFESESGFCDVRLNEPGGDVLEAQYVEPDDWSFIGLSGDRETISFRGTSDASLRAALIIQRSLNVPLRMIDTDYSFDLVLHDIRNVEELRAAIERARTD